MQPVDQRSVFEQDDAHVRRQVPGHAHHADLGATQLGGVPEDENLHWQAP